MKTMYPVLIGKPADYSKGENWMIRQDNGDCPVDVFYLYPTAANPKCTEEIAKPDQLMKFAALGNFERGPSCFDGIANVFAPYYRQLSTKGIFNSRTIEGFFDHVYNSEVRTDAYAALDYYFEHYNKNRPFILASHSQGSCMMYHILKEYMKIHPDYYKRMIVAYVVGMTVNNKFLEGAEHIKFAQGETDIGVVASWNVEAPGATMANFPVFKDAINCINPLNWKTDETYAPIEANKGSYDVKTHSIIQGVADAKINKDRMVVVTTTASKFGFATIPAKLVLFGEQSYHFDDWNFFYVNIKENAQKRIDAYFNKK